MLSEYGIELEADFHEYYRLDLLGMYTGKLSPAKVYRLAMALPQKSRFVRAAAGPQADWDSNEHLLAAILDTLQNANWQRGGGKGKRPKPIPRPGTQKEKRMGTTKRSQEEIRNYLSRLKRGEVKLRKAKPDVYQY